MAVVIVCAQILVLLFLNMTSASTDNEKANAQGVAETRRDAARGDRDQDPMDPIEPGDANPIRTLEPLVDHNIPITLEPATLNDENGNDKDDPKKKMNGEEEVHVDRNNNVDSIETIKKYPCTMTKDVILGVGHDLYRVMADSASDCCSACNIDEACRAFTFVVDTKDCYLKTSADGRKQSALRVSGE